jgi:hypothetical protein
LREKVRNSINIEAKYQGLTLTLFMAWVFTDHANDAFPANNLAIAAHFLN